MPDKSPRKPIAKKVADESLKEKRQDKKAKKAGNQTFGGVSPLVTTASDQNAALLRYFMDGISGGIFSARFPVVRASETEFLASVFISLTNEREVFLERCSCFRGLRAAGQGPDGAASHWR